jgi:hypothetical protein
MRYTKLRVLTLVFFWGLHPALAVNRAEAGAWSLAVLGGDVALGETPIVTATAAAVPRGVYRLVPRNGGEPAIAQVFEQGGQRFVAVIVPRVVARQSTEYAMSPLAADAPEFALGLGARPNGLNIVVDLGRRPLSEYRIDVGNKPFFYPLVGPSGQSYTRAYPMLDVRGEDRDHPHQRSCWFTFGNVNGIDFWSEGKNTGTIRETIRTLAVVGPVLLRLETRDDWLGPDARRICTDVRTVTFFWTRKNRIIDFEFKVRATDGPVEFRDTKEGMFGVRVASSMDAARKPGGKITTADGLIDEKAWGSAAPWVDYVGPVEGKTAGIAILNHPGSFRYPTNWHVRPYGLFAANPFGWHDFGSQARGDFTIPPGESIPFHYRLILHEGDTAAAGLPALFEGYAKPPAVEFKMN